MTEARDPRNVSARVEELLAELTSVGDARTRERAEELVRLLMELYGAGLARIVEILAAEDVHGRLADRMAADDLVASLLMLHDLHPHGPAERVQEALEKVRPYLGSHAGGVEFLGVDEAGVAHLRLEGSCDGCPSSTVTVKLAIERAIAEAAPEVTGVEVEGMTEPSTERPGHATSTTGFVPVEALRRPPSASSAPSAPEEPQPWTTVAEAAEVARGEVRRIDAAGTPVLVCNAAGQLYAYRNGCPACGAALDAAGLADTVLTCPTCRGRYDVRLAGRGLDAADDHLDPLPLLTEGGQIRIATTAGVRP